MWGIPMGIPMGDNYPKEHTLAAPGASWSGFMDRWEARPSKVVVSFKPGAKITKAGFSHTVHSKVDPNAFKSRSPFWAQLS